MKNVFLAGIIFCAASSPAIAQAQSPADAYRAYNAVVNTATSWDDLAPFMTAASMEDIRTASPEEQAMLFGFTVDIAKAREDIKVTSDSVQGDAGVVSAEFCMDNMTSTETVDFALENGEWRIAKVNLQFGKTRCDGVTGTPCSDEQRDEKVAQMQTLVNAYPEAERDAIVDETNEKVFAQMGGYPANDQYCDFVDAFNTTLSARQ